MEGEQIYTDRLTVLLLEDNVTWVGGYNPENLTSLIRIITQINMY